MQTGWKIGKLNETKKKKIFIIVYININGKQFRTSSIYSSHVNQKKINEREIERKIKQNFECCLFFFHCLLLRFPGKIKLNQINISTYIYMFVNNLFNFSLSVYPNNL